MATAIQYPAAAALSPINISGMDLETAIMLVQTRRANLLEEQLASQINEVKSRNDKISSLNNALTALNAYKNCYKSPDKATSTGKNGDSEIYEQKANDALQAAGSPSLGFQGTGQVKQPNGSYAIQTGEGIIGGGTTVGQLDTAINSIKSQIDAANNSNQMDMLRLQSLTNKRNEAFDIMTNFIKKMQDSRSSILGNMR
ncbi:MAG: hypothetical protein LCH89_21590 [Proteobacteria bacterium]|nr:hypothetical protein [Pseudomonadota bacterium]